MKRPDLNPRIGIIAELLRFENHIFLKEYEAAIPLGEAFLQKWEPTEKEIQRDVYRGKTFTITNSPRRQLITAQMFLAMAYLHAGYYEKSIEMCQEVRSEKWTADDPYKNFNVVGYSLLYEALSNEVLGNIEPAQKLRNECMLLFPEWYALVSPQIEERLLQEMAL